MRIKKKFHLKDPETFKKKALQWACKKTHCCYLNGNNRKYNYEPFPEILAVGCLQEFSPDQYHPSTFFDDLLLATDWAFGFLGYNSSEISIKQGNFIPGCFFIPSTIITFLNENLITIESTEDPDTLLAEISTTILKKPDFKFKGYFSPEITKAQYIDKIKLLKSHIQRGNIYQINYCIKFNSDSIFYDPYLIYDQLNTLFPMPFSGFLKAWDYCIVSASPERFLKKINTKIISQPMKGTSPVFSDEVEDKSSIQKLKNSEKERAENIMIVDLVRNDLSVICQDGSVKVEKLCELYSFQNVHQMVSTISGKLKENTSPSEIFDKTFPMGSMTGAPKIRAMELIEELESDSRGPFSGTMGYIDPKGNFDFNVLIRSLFYNSGTGKGFYSAGSGITILSNPEDEFEECMLKGETIKKIFQNEGVSTSHED